MSLLSSVRKFKRILNPMVLKQMCRDSSASTQSVKKRILSNEIGCDSLINPPLSYFYKLKKIVGKSNSTTYDLNDEDVHLITMGDLDRQRRLDMLLLELFSMESEGKPIPNFVTLYPFQRAVQIEHEDPQKYLYYFFHYCEKEKSKILSWMISKEEINVPQPPIHYLSHNTSSIVGLIETEHIKQCYRGSSGQGMQFGQNLVLDFSCLKWINQEHRMILASEIRNLILANGRSRRPFHLHFCSYLKNQSISPLVKYLDKGLSRSAVTLTADSYLQKFLRKDVIYFMPNSVNKVNYNPEDTYVLCPYHIRRFYLTPEDRGVRTAQLPYNFKWFSDNKFRTLSEVHEILTSWKELQGKNKHEIKFQ